MFHIDAMLEVRRKLSDRADAKLKLQRFVDLISLCSIMRLIIQKSVFDQNLV